MALSSADLNPAQRREALRRLREEPFDVLIIGAGATGAGAALDAASRGLKTAVVDAQDIAAGTSSRSTKLFHGGLRYLKMLEFRLVKEALKERDLLLETLAPHLVREVPFLYPLTHYVWERAFVGAGTALYDAMGGGHAVPRHRHLSRKKALELAPSLKPEALVGAIQYYDCQVDDARHVLAVARTAAAHGAQVATRVRVTDLLRENDRVVGARVLDAEASEAFDVRARVVIGATGVWSDELQKLVGGADCFQIRPSKGVHVLVPRSCIDAQTGFVLPTASSVLFIIPWGRHWIVGTTDTPWELDTKDHPAATKADIRYLLDKASSVLKTPLRKRDIEGVYVGLRPLVAGNRADTAKLSREHIVSEPVKGLVKIAGGKLTTYRIMAKDVIDVAVREWAERPPPSRTHEIPLVGAAGYRALADAADDLATEHNLPVEEIQHLLGRYGDETPRLLSLAKEHPEALRRLEGTDEYLRVEALFAAIAEGALHLEDLLVRRMRLAMETRDRGLGAARAAARILADALGWSPTRHRQELAFYQARVKAELRAEHQARDEAADAILSEATEVPPAVGA